MRWIFAVALSMGGLALSTVPAAAGGWSISKHGTMPSVEACMEKGRKVMNRYIFSNGGGDTGEDTWSLYAYDLIPGDQDAVIVCPIGGGGAVNAMMIIQNESSADDRGWAASELLSMWDDE